MHFALKYRDFKDGMSCFKLICLGVKLINMGMVLNLDCHLV